MQLSPDATSSKVDTTVGSRGKVFLSYGHDPACEEIVNRFAADLKLLGWEPWLDKRIEFGDTWRSEITRGLLESQHVLSFL